MRYLIIFHNHEHEPFITKWYSFENNYTEGMTVFDLEFNQWTSDGKTWKEITIDHL